MINLILGRPGSGKSYEAVVFHVIETIKAGRMVITNLPLNLEAIAAFFPESVNLIKIVNKSATGGPLPFTSIKDFQFEWRGNNGIGPLFVIDECHKFFPSSGTSRQVLEWFAEHRHLGVDLLLITQTPKNISRPILDMVQVVYRVSNNRTLGHDKSYVRKVQDGIRGEVISTSVRTYNPSYFQFYKSHTKSAADVIESQAQDIVPLWKKWPFVGAALFLGLGIPFFLYTIATNNPLQPKQMEQGVAAMKEARKPNAGHSLPSSAPAPAATPAGSSSSPVPSPEPEEPKDKDTPFGKVTIHIAGFIQSQDKKKTLYQFSASQNGQQVFLLSHQEILFAGYEVRANGPCSAELIYQGTSQYVICDAPRIGVFSNDQAAFVGGQ